MTLNRRQMLQSVGCGFGSLAFSGLLAAESVQGAGLPTATAEFTRQPMLVPRAKRVIFIFMQGGPSQVDTFDYKPSLAKYDGQQLPFRNSRKLANTGQSGNEPVMQSPWKFRQYGESGRWVSELFPQIAGRVDDLCFLHGLHTNGVAHGPSTLFLHTGATNLIRPSMGAWISYGLGTENRNLPAFVTICPSSGNGGPRNYSNAFLPAEHQGTAIGRAGLSAREAKIENLNAGIDRDAGPSRSFELLRELNASQLQRRGTDHELEAVVGSYELAWRMQMHAPELLDISAETPATQRLYGMDQKETEDFGRQCLLARRMAEAGVRFIQINYADNSNNPRWDQHSKIQQHAVHARATDWPIAGLLTDLKQRGLLEDTLVWWGGEFGRTPFSQGNDGRDHNPRGFTHFLCGGGVLSGFAFGETDEFGHEAVAGRVHMHDLHATVLHLLGVDHERLTYRYAGRDFRLTDLAGRVVSEIFA
ncbi:MAG: DUF1501 domain-containing protein [Planctomycetaceae bacterium]